MSTKLTTSEKIICIIMACTGFAAILLLIVGCLHLLWTWCMPKMFPMLPVSILKPDFLVFFAFVVLLECFRSIIFRDKKESK